MQGAVLHAPLWVRISLAIIFLLAGILAYLNAFIQDDAFISFIYARNFAEGNGLVWYPGSAEYGYSNFLFTLLVGLFMKLGLAEITASQLISVPAAFVGLVYTYKIGRLINERTSVALLATAALASSFTYTAYATSGLEMSLALALALAAYYYVLRWHKAAMQRHMFTASLCAALALLTRLDMAILLLPLYTFITFTLTRQVKDPDKRFMQLLKSGLLPCVAVLSMFVFCAVYYGQILPNSFAAKASGWHIWGGVVYIYTFLKAQYFMPVLLIGLWYIRVGAADFIWKHWHTRFALLGAIVLWSLYIIKVGGDFMEFRFILPILPFFYLLLLDLIASAQKNAGPLWMSTAGAIILIGNALQPLYFKGILMDDNYLESVQLLDEWVTGKPMNWTKTGTALNELFYTGNDTDVKIAVSAAGTIPYYSRLPTIDLHGLNTRAVLYTAEPFLDRPGHRRKARLDFVKKSGTNLIIDHPLYVKKRQRKSGSVNYVCQQAILWLSHQHLWHIPVIFIPTDKGYYLLAHYLAPHPKIDKFIANGTILTEKQVKRKIFCNYQKDKALTRWLQSP